MKKPVERRQPQGILDHISLAITTAGVGFLPLAPGTWGSIVGVLIFLGWRFGSEGMSAGERTAAISPFDQTIYSAFIVFVVVLSMIGIWASGRAISLLGNEDPSEAVIDEIVGQLTTFALIPFAAPWWVIFTGFVLFRFFDIAKPYPINEIQDLKGGLGVCADDLLAGIYAAVSLNIIYTAYMWFV